LLVVFSFRMQSLFMLRHTRDEYDVSVTVEHVAAAQDALTALEALVLARTEFHSRTLLALDERGRRHRLHVASTLARNVRDEAALAAANLEQKLLQAIASDSELMTLRARLAEEAPLHIAATAELAQYTAAAQARELQSAAATASERLAADEELEFLRRRAAELERALVAARGMCGDGGINVVGAKRLVPAAAPAPPLAPSGVATPWVEAAMRDSSFVERVTALPDAAVTMDDVTRASRRTQQLLLHAAQTL
jgi:hypothetical protein